MSSEVMNELGYNPVGLTHVTWGPVTKILLVFCRPKPICLQNVSSEIYIIKHALREINIPVLVRGSWTWKYVCIYNMHSIWRVQLMSGLWNYINHVVYLLIIATVFKCFLKSTSLSGFFN